MTEPKYRLDKHPQIGYQRGTNHFRFPLAHCLAADPGGGGDTSSLK